jgi:hypothetical protein
MEHDLAEVEHDWNIIVELRHDLGHDLGHDFWDMIFGHDFWNTIYVTFCSRNLEFRNCTALE